MIVFLSDFQHEDWYVASVHGAVDKVAPNARMVDLTHRIPPGDIDRASFLLEQSHADFADDTIFLSVVDPGVGTSRKGLLIRARNQWFVGPDNGSFHFLFKEPHSIQGIWHLDADSYPGGRKGFHTFHGRDVFGPVAGAVFSGVDPASLGKPLEPAELETDRYLKQKQKSPHREIVEHIDGFGNAVTTLEVSSLRKEVRHVVLEEVNLALPLCRAFGDVAPGEPLAYRGSSGRVEIGVRGASAAARYGLKRGMRVRIRE